MRDIQEARKVAAGKAFCIHGHFDMIMGEILSDKLNSCFLGAFTDLPRSISDVAQFYRTEEKKSALRDFWSQYLAPNYPVPFIDKLEGKEHCKPELYYEGVLKGARLVVDKCAKDTIFT